jgi:flavin reductase (DIM6/NTAB) family NADH-FMN oxidoreductase RutF
VLRQAHSFAGWQGIDRYAINVLNEEQEQVQSIRALQRRQWEGISPLTGDTGVPMLPNAAVVFECETHARFDGGDHEIFVARVAAMHEHSVNPGRPLVLFAGRYRQLARSANAHTPPHEAVLLHGW